MKFLVLILISAFGFSAFAAEKSCPQKAEEMAQFIRESNWGTHYLEDRATTDSWSQVTQGGIPYFRYYVEWIDHTVGGDAIIELYFNTNDCSLDHAQTYDL